MIIEAKVEPKLEYEIFKRDSFTCQICGESTPKVILFVGYRVPPEDGGTDDPDNLATYCHKCSGKKPLEMLSKRREQLSLMLEWKKALKNFQDDTLELVFDFINEMMPGYSLNDNGKKGVVKDIKKYGYKVVLETVQDAAERSIEYEENGDATKQSAEDFLNNISRYLAHKAKTPIEQRIGYVCGICKNRFRYFNRTAGMSLLREYVDVLTEAGWSEDEIVAQFEKRVYAKAKECTNWSDWKTILENSIADMRERIRKKASTPAIDSSKHFTAEELEQHAWMDGVSARGNLEILLMLYRKTSRYTPEGEAELRKVFLAAIYDFLVAMRKQFLDLGKKPDPADKSLLESAVASVNTYEFFGGYDPWGEVKQNIPEPMDSSTEIVIAQSLFPYMLSDTMESYFYPRFGYDYDNCITILDLLIEDYQGQLFKD